MANVTAVYKKGKKSSPSDQSVSQSIYARSFESIMRGNITP